MIRTMIGLAGSALVLATATPAAPAKPLNPGVIVDAEGNVRQFYGVPFTLTKAGLKRLPFSVKAVQTQSEGIDYTEYEITARRGMPIQVAFDDDGSLYSVESVSPKARDSKGVGVGSTLAEARTAWPKGRLIFGGAEGGYVTFITGTNVLLRFDPDDMPKGAFSPEAPYDIPVSETIKVRKISIYPKRQRTPEGTPKPDPNKNWITSEQGGKIITRLDVERTPGTSRVRLIWTRDGTVEADQVIDVTPFADFDIWAREVVRASDPVVVVFRRGNFKNCQTPDDDRDKVFVTLTPQKVTAAVTPLTDVKLGEASNLPKRFFIGESIKSEKYGCRRTYDPTNGAFGLEAVK